MYSWCRSQQPSLPIATKLPDPVHQSMPHHMTCEELPDEDDSAFTSHTPASQPLTLSPTSAPASIPPVLIPPNVSPIQVGAQAFHMLLKLPDTQVFKLCLLDVDIHAHLAQATSSKPYNPLQGVSKKYHIFSDVFSKSKVQVLSKCQPYDLKINLEESAIPPSPGHLYLLSALKQEALQKFIQINLNIGFICTSKLGHSVPALFICKKDGSWHLCSDFCNLNKITKKDH